MFAILFFLSRWALDGGRRRARVRGAFLEWNGVERKSLGQFLVRHLHGSQDCVLAEGCFCVDIDESDTFLLVVIEEYIERWIVPVDLGHYHRANTVVVRPEIRRRYGWITERRLVLAIDQHRLLPTGAKSEG